MNLLDDLKLAPLTSNSTLLIPRQKGVKFLNPGLANIVTLAVTQREHLGGCSDENGGDTGGHVVCDSV